MKLQSILMPLSEFDHVEKGDALYGKFSFPRMLQELAGACFHDTIETYKPFDLFIFSCEICDIFYDRSAKHSLRRYVTFFSLYLFPRRDYL